MSQMISQIVAFLSAHPNLAVLILLLVAFGEALLFVGLFVPSTPIMIGAGALVGLGKLGLFPVLVASALGAIAGDALSFWIGRKYKDQLTSRWPLSTHPDLLASGQRFFIRYGSVSIFLARFVPVVKAVLPTVAGMAGMVPLRFAVVNVLSAFVWSAAHLFPSMVLGRGLGVAATANPKVIELFAALLVLAVLAWVAARVLFWFVAPRLANLRLEITARWITSAGPVRRWIGGHLASAGTPASVMSEILLGVAGLSGLVILAGLVLLDPELAIADAALSNWVLSTKSDLATRSFLAVTMIADWRVLFPLAVIMVGCLFFFRQWRLAAVLVCAFAATYAFVPIVKLLIQRSRPTALYNGAEAFSFPSGHATHATVILGAAALLVAASFKPPGRRFVYGLIATLIVTVAVSRIYLGAHWPTDVLAGLMFGAVVLTTVAVLTRSARAALGHPGLAVCVVLGLGILYPLHLYRNYGASAAFYAPGPQVRAVARADWLTGVPTVPQTRTLLDGDAGEPMLAQSDALASDIIAALAAQGWRVETASWWAEIADVSLPTRSGLDSLAPWPLTHIGNPPVATLVEPAARNQTGRRVLRLWDSGLRVGDAAGRPILILSASLETLDPIGWGFSMIESQPVVELNLRQMLEGFRIVSPLVQPPILTKD